MKEPRHFLIILGRIAHARIAAIDESLCGRVRSGAAPRDPLTDRNRGLWAHGVQGVSPLPTTRPSALGSR